MPVIVIIIIKFTSILFYCCDNYIAGKNLHIPVKLKGFEKVDRVIQMMYVYLS